MSAKELLLVDKNILSNIITSLNYMSKDIFQEDVNKLKNWVLQTFHISKVMDYKIIENFLILNKGNVEKTKNKINNYYNMRKQLPYIFKEINPRLPYMENNFDTYYFVPLPKLTKEMYRIFIFKMRSTDLKQKFNPIFGIRYILNFQEIRLLEDVMFGDIIIFDGKDMPLNFVLNMTPTVIYTMLNVLYKKVYSDHIKAIYIVNEPSCAVTLLKIFKPLISRKVFRRMHFCENYEELLQKFGKEVLPKDFGGQEKSLNELQKMVQQKFQQYEKHFDDLDKICETEI